MAAGCSCQRGDASAITAARLGVGFVSATGVHQRERRIRVGNGKMGADPKGRLIHRLNEILLAVNQLQTQPVGGTAGSVGRG